MFQVQNRGQYSLQYTQKSHGTFKLLGSCSAIDIRKFVKVFFQCNHALSEPLAFGMASKRPERRKLSMLKDKESIILVD